MVRCRKKEKIREPATKVDRFVCLEITGAIRTVLTGALEVFLNIPYLHQFIEFVTKRAANVLFETEQRHWSFKWILFSLGNSVEQGPQSPILLKLLLKIATRGKNICSGSKEFFVFGNSYLVKNNDS